MAVSKVDICNSALAKVGAARISTLDDNTKEARLCKELYPRLSRSLLRSHPWNFAIERVAVSSVVSTPAFGFDFKFLKPSDCLRVLNVNEEFADETGKYYAWKVEGDYILANSDELKIKYIKDLSNYPEDFDHCFTEVLAYLLASELAYPLSQSNTLAESLFQKYRSMLSEARTFDAQEGSVDRVGADSWLDSRL